MGMTCDISGAVRLLNSLPDRARMKAVDFLAAVGDRFCEVARATKTYNDVTGRLTASIGWGVAVGGQIVREGGFGSGEGGDEGRKSLYDAAQMLSNATTPTLIVTAGMCYAMYVERSGYAVLDGARVRMDDIVQSLISTLEL